MKLIFFTIFLLLFQITVTGQPDERFTISGYVKEAVSGETLIGVNIYLSDYKTGTLTNNYGFYSITLPQSDSVELIVSYVGFTPEIVKVALQNNVELNVELKANNVLNEVTVIADRQVKRIGKNEYSKSSGVSNKKCSFFIG